MEFGLRTVLIGFCLLVIAAILIDGFRRMRRSNKGSLDLPAEMGNSNDDEWEYYKGELPNGGARSVSLRKEPKIDEADYLGEDRQEPSFGSASSDDEYTEEPLYAQSDLRSEPDTTTRRIIEPDAFEDPLVGKETSSALGQEPQANLFEDDEMLAQAKAEQERKLAAHYKGNDSTPKRASRPQQTAEQEPMPEPVSDVDEDIDLGVQELADVIVINVMAKPGEEIHGEDLYKAMTSCGFHHGDMDIFHRYEQHNGQGRLLFSVANCVEPGTFDPSNMADFSSPGICMFLKLPGPKRPLQAFDVLLDSARRISSLLGADMKDEHHSVMTQQTFEHYRQRVVEFERRQQLSQRALVR